MAYLIVDGVDQFFEEVSAGRDEVTSELTIEPWAVKGVWHSHTGWPSHPVWRTSTRSQLTLLAPVKRAADGACFAGALIGSLAGEAGRWADERKGRMIQGLIETVIENGFQANGWIVLRVVAIGRYQGFAPKDMLREGAVGLATVLAVGYGLYRWVW